MVHTLVPWEVARPVLARVREPVQEFSMPLGLELALWVQRRDFEREAEREPEHPRKEWSMVEWHPLKE